MLIAKKEDGSYISLLNDNGNVPRGEKYFCPACEGVLHLKMGTKRRPHFAHKHAECRAFTEPESDYHLEGKLQLFYLLSKYGTTTLEYYLQETRQRMDVLLETPSLRLAIEYQCSTISSDLVIKRTNDYVNQQIRPVWILGRNRFLAQYIHSISPFEWLFLYQPTRNSYPYFITFCPYERYFTYIYPYFAYSPSKALTTLYKSKNLYVHSSPPFFIPATWKETWLHYKRKWRYNYCLYKGMLSLKNFCYTNFGLSLTQIGGEVGLPVLSQFLISTPLIEWQAWLFYENIYPVQNGSFIHLPSVQRRFEKRVNLGIIELRRLPFINYSSYLDVVEQYLETLVKVGILTRKGEGIYVKNSVTSSLNDPQELLKQEEKMIKSISIV